MAVQNGYAQHGFYCQERRYHIHEQLDLPVWIVVSICVVVRFALLPRLWTGLFTQRQLMLASVTYPSSQNRANESLRGVKVDLDVIRVKYAVKITWLLHQTEWT